MTSGPDRGVVCLIEDGEHAGRDRGVVCVIEDGKHAGWPFGIKRLSGPAPRRHAFG